MAISEVNNNQSILSRFFPVKSKEVAAPANKNTNADGDTLKLSGNTPDTVNKTAVYTQPKPVKPLNDPALKATNGTAADADLKKIPAAVK